MKNLLLLFACAFACAYVHAQCGSPSYVDPQFTISVQNPACPLVGEITVVSASDGVPPYTYTLMPNNVSNGIGFFTNLTPGSYTVQMRDACGTVRSRQATIVPYSFVTSSTISSLGCRNFAFTIGCSATGPRLQYGYALNGNAAVTWGDSSAIHLTLDAPNTVDLYVKDSCGNVAVSHQLINKEMNGYIKELQERIMCNGQEIYPEYYGFDSPKVCLYLSPQNTLVECKQAPSSGYTGGSATNFFNLPFGQNYYVIVQDGCYRDSAFFKDKRSMGGSELNPFAWYCTSFDLHSDGNNSDSVCLYNATTNQLISCKHKDTTSINPHTGLPWPYGGAEWYGLPYGSYYSYIYDPCADTLIRIDTTVVYPRAFSTQMYFTCYITESAVGSYFGPESPTPHITTIYYPDSTIAASYTDAGNYLTYPTWPHPGTITVVQQDGCGYKDTTQLFQPDLLPTRTISFRGGCPGINGNSGGADLVLSGSAAAYGGRGNGAPVATVAIISKDGVPVTIPQSYTTWNGGTNQQDFYFTNLTTGVYIVESTIGCAGYKIYDTTVVKPYVYPQQDQTHIMQCGINPFAFKDTITGGVSPYTYEIVSTTAAMPSLLTGPQASNVFTIPPGTNLSTISIQVIDACGNSDTKVYPVNHSVSCTTLAVDTPVSRPVLQNKSVTVYPNPSSKQFTIAFAQKKKTDYQIEIYNVAGIKVYSKSLKDVDTKNVLVTENLQPGAYVIEVFDLKGNKPFYQKHIVL